MDDERKKSNRVAKAKVPDGNDDDDLLSFAPFPKMAKAMKDSKPVVKPDPSMTVGVAVGIAVAVAAANNTKAACKPKKEAKIKKAPPEKRLKRHRSKPTHGISTRINRARTQRLFLVHTSDSQHDAHPHGGKFITFAVLGFTGNVYQVVLSKVPSCSCPDHAKGNLCKHILFVMLKVVGLESHSPLVYQAAYLTNELEDIVQRLQERRASVGLRSDVVAKVAVRKRFSDLTEKEAVDVSETPVEEGVQRQPIEGSCPICFDELGTNQSLLIFCKKACGINFHKECIKMWTSQQNQNSEPTCPNCRQPWIDVATGGGSRTGVTKRQGRTGRVDEGYTNLGDLQGQRRNRDTSTYESNEYEYNRHYGSSRRRYR